MKKILIGFVVAGCLSASGCGTYTTVPTATATPACRLAGFHAFYHYMPNPLSGGSGQTAALGPTILRMNHLDVTPANEGQFHETVGPHCFLKIRWTPTGSANTYTYTLSKNGTMTVVNNNAALALSVAAGRPQF